MDKVRVRFAPSPTGFAHLGNLRTAVFDWLLAKHAGGEFILRVEDTDQARLVPGVWMRSWRAYGGLVCFGTRDRKSAAPYSPYFQSERLGLYRMYAERLLEQGDAYYCFCTSERLSEMRKEQESRKQPTGYDRVCLNLTPDEVAQKFEAGLCGVIRFRIRGEDKTSFVDTVRGEITFENRLLDDFVIMKSDGFPTYHFASVVDDHLNANHPRNSRRGMDIEYSQAYAPL